jgi:hypothetical protein
MHTEMVSGNKKRQEGEINKYLPVICGCFKNFHNNPPWIAG